MLMTSDVEDDEVSSNIEQAEESSEVVLGDHYALMRFPVSQKMRLSSEKLLKGQSRPGASLVSNSQ